MKKYKQKGIPTVVYYPICLHEQAAFNLLNDLTSLPIAESFSRQVFSIPMHGYLNLTD
jgi:dTDP-4-amino-4,6-dideoxygalactose transaminase